MNQVEIDRFRLRLRDIRDRLIDELQHTGEAVQHQLGAQGDLSKVPTHNADQDTEGLDEEIEVGHSQQTLLTEVEEALAKIERGTYGVCERCERKIQRKRLDALPYAVYCIDCERQIESEEGLEAGL